MSANSNDQGRAYEYAWINTLYNALHEIRNTRIVNNSSLDANKRAWMVMSDEMQEMFEISADFAVDTILELEPLMSENDGDELLLEFQQDGAGTRGDVRDIVVKRNDIHWEIGLSIKHNHEAVKHSRLSHGLDFGNEWFGIPCSKEYWNAVKPIFDRLKSEKAKGRKWSEIDDKEGTVYIPLLQAFIDEVHRALRSNEGTVKDGIAHQTRTFSLSAVSENELEKSDWLVDPTSDFANVEARLFVESAMEMLSPLEQEIFSSCLLGEMPIRQFAERNGMRKSTAWDTANSIRKKLQEFF